MSKGGGAAYLKKINRSKIVEVILEHGMISRADISKVTGINKATISAQVAELLEEELVCEKEIEYNQVGRRPIMRINQQRVWLCIGNRFRLWNHSVLVSRFAGEPHS